MLIREAERRSDVREVARGEIRKGGGQQDCAAPFPELGNLLRYVERDLPDDAAVRTVSGRVALKQDDMRNPVQRDDSVSGLGSVVE